MKKKLLAMMLSLSVVILILAACNTGDSSNNAFTISKITISSDSADIAVGDTLNLTANVTGTNLSPERRKVNWSIKETDIDRDTGIVRLSDNSGVLTVSEFELLDDLTVVATSVADPSVSGEYTVHVYDPNQGPPVSEINIIPKSATVPKGGTWQFNVEVVGNEATLFVPITKTWSVVETGTSAGTNITTDGLLTIATDETLASLTVKIVVVVGDADETTFSDTAIVTITDN